MPDAVRAAERELTEKIRGAIRDIPDFPKPGIVFKDITPLLGDARLFRQTTAAMAEPFSNDQITHVVAIESRGFLLGAPVAQHLGVGLVPIRKPGKLPAAKRRMEYALEYGVDALEIHADACAADARVLIVDDVLATGGTASAARRLVELIGATVVGCSFLIELTFLGGREAMGGTRSSALIAY
ncbi:MAG TPA: adenine phosphoribosyltransferase [Gemmatimonadaceae bacterium]|nr:adenine phosphoribosyltransferase [Gemmatimonadaceae bacterium]